MSGCIWCGKHSIFNKVDSNGLCQKCGAAIYPDIEAKKKYVSYCYKRIKESTKFDVKVSHLELLQETLKKLKIYEDKKIPTLDFDVDLTDVFANVKGPIFKVTIDKEKREKAKNLRG